MEIDRKNISKNRGYPTCIKDNNINLSNVFDTSMKLKKENDGFKRATKLKRNFK